MDPKDLLEFVRAYPEKPSVSARRTEEASGERIRGLSVEERMIRALSLRELSQAFCGASRESK